MPSFLVDPVPRRGLASASHQESKVRDAIEGRLCPARTFSTSLCPFANSRAFCRCSVAWADPCWTWLERKGEGKGKDSPSADPDQRADSTNGA